ncbi:hypothetical protein Leryth_011823 [Lithospermum erythrorhizon]|nr:hypothetical protein Leryth_011823 [Lithospermum erythrorhizon]
MINLDNSKLFKAGRHFKALPFISNGAVSLDSGIIKGAGIFSLSIRGNVNVKFLSEKIEVSGEALLLRSKPDKGYELEKRKD